MAITTVDDLRSHVALATRVELSTIPPYLYAMYSIKDQQSVSARLIASVVVEEMLHACLTTNLLLAIGGEPEFGYDIIASYPSLLAHHTPELLLELKACTPELVRETFMAIESPRAPGAAPEDDIYETLGQFYAALEQALDNLNDTSDLFGNHQPERQLSDPAFYAPVAYDAEDSGGLTLIHDRMSADQALEIIIHQGEGLSTERWADPDHQELTHYYKFELIADGTAPIGPVWPVLDNPRTADFPERLWGVSTLFNAFYGLIYITMRDLYSGAQAQRAAVDRLYALMSDCLAPTAQYLARQPVTDDRTAGATFEVYQFEADPWIETIGLAETVGEDHHELEEVASRISGFVVASGPGTGS